MPGDEEDDALLLLHVLGKELGELVDVDLEAQAHDRIGRGSQRLRLLKDALEHHLHVDVGGAQVCRGAALSALFGIDGREEPLLLLSRVSREEGLKTRHRPRQEAKGREGSALGPIAHGGFDGEDGLQEAPEAGVLAQEEADRCVNWWGSRTICQGEPRHLRRENPR